MSFDESIHILAKGVGGVQWRDTEIPWIKIYYAEGGVYLLQVRMPGIAAGIGATYAAVEAGSPVEAVNRFLDLKRKER